MHNRARAIRMVCSIPAAALMLGAQPRGMMAQRAAALYAAWGPLLPGPYAVGFRVHDERDYARTVGAPTTTGGRRTDGDTHRRLLVSVWYPAVHGTPDAAPLRFADYVRLMAPGRAPSVFATPVFDAHQDFRSPPFDSASDTELDSALRVPAAARLNAARAAGRFPLVVVGEGLDFDSPVAQSVLGEYLASHGYVVASVPYLGTPFRESGHDRLGLENETRDLEWLMARMRAEPGVDTTRTAVVGFDYGGLAAVLLAMRNSDIRAVVSIDAGIMYAHNLVLLRQFAEYDPVRLRVPMMQVTVPASENRARGLTEDLSLFRSARFASTYLLRVRGMMHADFTTYGMLWNAVVHPRAPGATARVAGYATMARYTLDFLDAVVRQRASAAAVLAGRPEENGVPRGELTIERTRGLPAPPSERELVRILLDHGADSAMRVLRAVQTADAGFVPFRETLMNALGYTLLARHELRRALGTFQLNVAAFPRSWNAHDSLGEAYLALGDTAQAIASYRRSLALDPANTNAATVLRRLGSHP